MKIKTIALFNLALLLQSFVSASSSMEGEKDMATTLPILGTHSTHTYVLKEKVTLEDFQELLLKRSPQYRNFIIALTKIAFTKPTRPIRTKGENLYGNSFPIQPESLYYLLERCEGKTVLEVGSADGIVSILFALAGAKKVYVNDITKEEIEGFKNLAKDLPSELGGAKGKFVAAVGNIIDILPILSKGVGIGGIDIIAMYNVFHFIPTDQHAVLFSRIRKILNLAGTIVITANGKVNLYKTSADEEKYCGVTHFSSTFYMLDKFLLQDGVKKQAVQVVGARIIPFSPEKKTESKEEVIFRNAQALKVKKVPLPSELEEFEKDLLLAMNNPELVYGEVRRVDDESKMFSPEDIKNILENHKFTTTSSFHIDPTLHAHPAVKNLERHIKYYNFAGVIATPTPSTSPPDV